MVLCRDLTDLVEFKGTSNCSVREAVRATTAAPTFYTPAIIGGMQYVDGAVLAANPACIALAEAAAIWPGRDVELFLSLGTGERHVRPNTANSVVGWVCQGASRYRPRANM